MSPGLAVFTLAHILISLVGIVSGLIVASGLLAAKRLDLWTTIFLSSTAATSVTGFLFPFHGFTPALGVGLISILVLLAAWFARYRKTLAGSWRWIYVIAAMLALYLNVFVLVVQSFLKIPAIHELAPTQSEPAFIVAQLLVLMLFVGITAVATNKFRGTERIHLGRSGEGVE